MFCSKCGKEIVADSKFCQACGAEASMASPVPTSDQTACEKKATPSGKCRPSGCLIFGILVLIGIIVAIIKGAAHTDSAAPVASTPKSSSAEKPMTWAEIKKAKADLNKSWDEVKTEFKTSVGVNPETKAKVEHSDSSGNDASKKSTEILKSAIYNGLKDAIVNEAQKSLSSDEMNEMKSAAKSLLSDDNLRELKESKDDLEAALNELKNLKIE
ncbi:MAG: zinc ribbon domain-containing protein [Kiritimatiellia bacterium]